MLPPGEWMCHRCTVRRKVKPLLTVMVPALPTVRLKRDPCVLYLPLPLMCMYIPPELLFVLTVVKGFVRNRLKEN